MGGRGRRRGGEGEGEGEGGGRIEQREQKPEREWVG